MLEVKNLQKRFRLAKKSKDKSNPQEQGKWFHALRDVSFSCEPGQILGLLGPNGAGKTTSLRILSTALKPTAGQILINGEDVVAQPMAMRKRIGFLSGMSKLYHRLTVRENVRYFGRLHGMEPEELETEIERVFQQLDIHDFADKKADSLSTGMAQRANIARTVIHKPEVIVLDEPTTGLDVMSSRTILDFIESLKGGKTPVIFSTHHLHEVERLCDNVTFIDQGETRFNGTQAEFRELNPGGNLYEVFVQLVNSKEVA